MGLVAKYIYSLLSNKKTKSIFSNWIQPLNLFYLPTLENYTYTNEKINVYKRGLGRPSFTFR